MRESNKKRQDTLSEKKSSHVNLLIKKWLHYGENLKLIWY